MKQLLRKEEIIKQMADEKKLLMGEVEQLRDQIKHQLSLQKHSMVQQQKTKQKDVQLNVLRGSQKEQVQIKNRLEDPLIPLLKLN